MNINSVVFLWECDSDQFFIPHISQFLIEISFFKVICLILLKAWYFDEAIQWTLGNVHWIRNCERFIQKNWKRETYNLLLQKGVKIENQYHFDNFWMLIMITFWHYFLFHTKSILNHLRPAEYFSLAFYAERVENSKIQFWVTKRGQNQNQDDFWILSTLII